MARKYLERGDRVRLKGRKPKGVIETMGTDDNWICVRWDTGTPGPKYVHLFELEEDKD